MHGLEKNRKNPYDVRVENGGHDRFRTYDLYSVNVALSP
jgi:hypothetical protein